MPARTLSPPPRNAGSSRQPSNWGRWNSHAGDGRGEGDDQVEYDMTVPPPHIQHVTLPTSGLSFDQPASVYPSPPIPPIQIHHHPNISSTPFLSFPGPPGHPPRPLLPAMNNPPLWHTQYYRAPPPLPPPPIPHKVWILDCKSCGKFLTNRGMKAVLLLRPNVPLYSTDAMPINCSAYSPPTETRSNSTPFPSSAGPNHGHPSFQSDVDRSRSMARTCECLTQTLSCHGCGSSVGYMIVSPCQRCTSSISVTNRTTNGHRFVFYSSEIAACERHYIAGEGGVVPFNPPSPPVVGYPPPQSANPAHPHPHPHGQQQQHQHYMQPQRPPSPGYDFVPNHPPDSDGSWSSGSSRSGSGHTTPELTSSFNAMSLSSRRESHHHHHQQQQQPSRRSYESSRSQHRHHNQAPVPQAVSPSSYGPSHSHSHRGSDNPYVQDGRVVPFLISTGQPEPAPEPLKAGEVLFWHHLVRSGEIPGVVEDARARGALPLSPTTPDSASPIDAKAASPVSATSSTAPKRRFFAGC